MRVTYDVIRDGLTAINKASDQLAAARLQVTTGRRVQGPSGDPRGVQQAIGEHTEMGTLDSYTRSAQSASSRLAAVDTVLADVVDKLTASIVAATSARGSTATPASRAAAAQALRGYRDALVADVNMSFQGSQLFSGSRTDQPAYAQIAGAWTYQGDSAAVQVEIDRGRLVTVGFNGQEIVQGSDAADLFTALDDLIAAVESGDAAGLGLGIGALERAFDRAVQAQGRLGADERGVDDAAARLSALRVASETRRAHIEDANMAESIARMNQADMAYRAALGAVSTAERTSLLDYL